MVFPFPIKAEVRGVGTFTPPTVPPPQKKLGHCDVCGSRSDDLDKYHRCPKCR